MKAYNSMIKAIKAVIAAEGIKNYKVTECRGNNLYGGVECYTQYASGTIL